jgi:hypothetical protein
MRRRDGTAFGRVLTTPVAAEAALGAVLTFRDITARKRLERAWRTSRRRGGGGDALTGLANTARSTTPAHRVRARRHDGGRRW